MNEFNTTDQEQIEMIKKWWNDYGKIIAIAVAIGLIAAFGWRYWRHHKMETTQKASNLYGQLGIADLQKKPKAAEKIAENLMKNYKSTPYGTMAALWWAKALVDEKNYNGALEKAEWAVSHSHTSSFKQVARLRVARILLYQKKPKAALDALKTVSDKAYQPLIDEVKGDIYTAMNQPDAAVKAYKAAKAGMSAAGVTNPILNMKLAAP